MLVMTGIGMSYAGFTDLVYVRGEIDTATVKLEYISNSHTYVWKVMYDGEPLVPPFDWSNVVIFDWDPDNEFCYLRSYEGTTAEDVEAWFETAYPNGPGLVEDVSYWRVAWAEATTDPNDDHIMNVDMHNIFPCNTYMADFIYHYDGSIPARLTVGDLITTEIVNGPYYTGDGYDGDNWMEDLWLWHIANPGSEFGIYYTAWQVTIETNDDGEVVHSYIVPGTGPLEDGYQVHNCDYLIVLIWIHLPQDNQFQGCSGKFSIDLGAVQWTDPCLPPPE
jgi:hypothetical protein